MPVFAFAYGSFGDILATAQLVAKIVITLRHSGRPSRGWTESENELKGLGSDLAYLTLHPTPEPVIASRIQQEVARCHLLMTRFFAKILASQGLVQKVLWAVSEEKELAEFRAQVIERRTALGFLLGLINSGALEAVRDRLEEVGGQVTQGNALVRDVHEDVPRGVSDETFIVLSPTNVPIPISVAYCTSYEVLDGILKAYMHGLWTNGNRDMKRGGLAITATSWGHYSPRWLNGVVIDPSQLIEKVKAGRSLHLTMGVFTERYFPNRGAPIVEMTIFIHALSGDVANG